MTTNNTSTGSSGGSPPFTTLLAIADGVLTRQMALFLTGREAAQLSLLSLEWRQFVQTHEEALFRDYLEQDFIEGAALITAVNRRKEQQEQAQNADGQGQAPCTSTSFSYKQMYLAFHRRWKLPQESMDDGQQEWSTNKPPIVLPWRNPYEFCEPPKEPSKDARALVFLVGVGNVNDDNIPKMCGLLEWSEDPDEDQLVLDEDVRNVDYRSVDFAVLKKQVSQWIDEYRYNCDDDDFDHDTLYSKVADAICASYLLTVHVVDLETYKVATLMENAAPLGCEVELPDDTVDSSHWEIVTTSHTGGGTSLYGAKPPGSPFHTPFPDIVSNDRKYFNAPEEHHVETFDMSGSVCLRVGKAFRHLRYQDNDNVVYVNRSSGISFDFDSETTLVRRDEICSFLRALMKEKCHPPPRPAVSLVAPVIGMPQQPTWVTQATVLDTIISFSSFEEQAGALRLVCRRFKDSAMQQLETKLLDELKVIGCDRGYDGWFKGSVSRGWSNDPFGVSKDSVIQEALGMASCRCRTAFDEKGSCPGMDRCPGAIKAAASGRAHCGFDVGKARKLLETKGRLNSTTALPNSQQRPDAKIRFEEGEKSLFRVCHDIEAAIYDEVPEWYDDEPSSFQRFHGPSADRERFIRSLFLVFVHTPYSDSDNDERPSKRAQVAKPSIGFANSCVDGFTRMKMIARFSTACGEPIEILLEIEGNL